MRIQHPLFQQDDSNNPSTMASAFGLPYLGKLPMDPNMTKACEDGASFTENYPNSAAVMPLNKIIDQIIKSCEPKGK